MSVNSPAGFSVLLYFSFLFAMIFCSVCFILHFNDYRIVFRKQDCGAKKGNVHVFDYRLPSGFIVCMIG